MSIIISWEKPGRKFIKPWEGCRIKKKTAYGAIQWIFRGGSGKPYYASSLKMMLPATCHQHAYMNSLKKIKKKPESMPDTYVLMGDMVFRQ